MAKRQLVTLLTDFGLADPYAAAMKGVILSLCPGANIVDVSHEVPPQDVLAGAMVLAQSAPYFPPETLHVVVVDPGVGTDRRILVAKLAGQMVLAPDNGVITLLTERLRLDAIIVVRNPRYLPSGASRTFHGRDVFAPIAGHILNGLDINSLGPQPDSYKLLDLPQPDLKEQDISGQVIYVDRFGNLVSNITERLVRESFPDLEAVTITCAGRPIGGLTGTYGFADPGELLALFDSMGYVEVAVNGGRACDALGAGVGAEMKVAVG